MFCSTLGGDKYWISVVSCVIKEQLLIILTTYSKYRVKSKKNLRISTGNKIRPENSSFDLSSATGITA